MNKLPKISIVTPSFNLGKYIEETISSVLSQNYDNFEYFVIDGGSTDNTLSVLTKYENQPKYKPKFTWVSEKDNGQTDAGNKGLRMCSGDWFSFLNADDYYEPNIFNRLANEMSLNIDKGVIYGNCWNRFEGLSNEYNFLSIPSEKISPKQWSKGNYIYGPASFYNMKAIKSVGEFDVKLHHWMDYDMYARISKQMEMKYINMNIANFRIVKDQKSPFDPALRHSKANKFFIFEAYLVSRRNNGKRFSSLWLQKFWIYREYLYLFAKLKNIIYHRENKIEIAINKQNLR